MSVTSLIEYDNALEHEIPAALELSGDKGRMKSQALSSEVLFSNFDTDGELTSKRGAKELVLSGNDNTGLVEDGVLKFPNQDASRGDYSGITSIIEDFAFRAKVIMNITVPSTDRDIVRLVSNVDSSQVRFYVGNNGGGQTRVTRSITNSAGAVVSSVPLGVFTFTPGSSFDIAFSCDADGNTLTFINGDLVSTVAAPAFNFTNCDFRFGNNTVSVASFDNVQLWNSHAITAAYTSPIPEPTTYVLTEQIMTTIIPLMVDKVISLDVVSEIPSGSQIKHFLDLDGDRYVHNGSAWVLADIVADMLPQANTLAEIQANLSTIPVVEGIGKTVQIGHVFKSDSGYDTALVESLTMKYNYAVKPGEVILCAIYGDFKDNAGNVVEGGTVRVQSKDKFINNAFIGPSAKVTSNAQGKYSISVPETETDGTSVDFVFEYTEKQLVNNVETDVPVTYTLKKRVIPNLPTAQMGSLAQLA